MPYLILIFGILVAGFALYKFLVRASVEQVRFLFRTVFFVLYCGMLLFFAMTGRIIISIGLVLLLCPFIIAYFRKKKSLKKDNQDTEIN